jgi:two-component system, NarL family, response regulator LiaR
MTVSVVLVEPRRLRREAFAIALDASHSVVVAAATSDHRSAILQCERVRPDVVVASPETEALRALCSGAHAVDASIGTLVLDRDPCEASLLTAIESGAAGYVTGHGGLAGVIEAINSVAQGRSVVPPALLGPLLRGLIERQREAAEAADRLAVLTRREREVLVLLVDGRDDAGIAAELVISPETARTHVHRVLRKLGVHSRLAAVSLAAKTGLAERLERLVERSAS